MVNCVNHSVSVNLEMVSDQCHGFPIIRILLSSQSATLLLIYPWLQKLQIFKQYVEWFKYGGFNNHLYLHPSETPGATLVYLHQLLIGSDNYGVWRWAMIIPYKLRKKLGFTDGTIRKTRTTLPFFFFFLSQRERCNAVVLAWIMNSISEELCCIFNFRKGLFDQIWKRDLKD